MRAAGRRGYGIEFFLMRTTVVENPLALILHLYDAPRRSAMKGIRRVVVAMCELAMSRTLPATDFDIYPRPFELFYMLSNWTYSRLMCYSEYCKRVAGYKTSSCRHNFEVYAFPWTVFAPIYPLRPQRWAAHEVFRFLTVHTPPALLYYSDSLLRQLTMVKDSLGHEKPRSRTFEAVFLTTRDAVADQGWLAAN